MGGDLKACRNPYMQKYGAKSAHVLDEGGKNTAPVMLGKGEPTAQHSSTASSAHFLVFLAPSPSRVFWCTARAATRQTTASSPPPPRAHLSLTQQTHYAEQEVEPGPGSQRGKSSSDSEPPFAAFLSSQPYWHGAGGRLGDSPAKRRRMRKST